MESAEEIFYHALASRGKFGYRTLLQAHQAKGSWKHVWLGTHQKEDPQKEWLKLSDEGVRLVLLSDPEYPPLLKEIPWPPLGLYIKGELPKSSPTLAIVGTRKGTSEGKVTARAFAAAFARAGVNIVSGLALGIDAEAHTGCLEGGGKTVAVLGTGVLKIYPRTHERLAQEILKKGGAIVSEYFNDKGVAPYRFLERNRIVSGLSQGVLVIEAPEDSGALTTARFAMEQNRDVFVLPGPATHPNFKGSHRLLREGAELVTSPEHILEAWRLTPLEPITAGTASQEEDLVLEILKRSLKPLSVDKIIEFTHLEARLVNRTLALLTLKHLIKEAGEGYAIN